MQVQQEIRLICRINDIDSEPMRLQLLLLSLFLLVKGSFSQGDPVPVYHSGIGANFRIHPGNVTQSEVLIARNPVNPDILFSACNTISFIPFFISEGIYVTTDAGLTWTGSDTCKGDPIGYHGGDPGITVDRNGTFILTRLGRAPFVGLYSHYSTDNGQTWSMQQVISTDDLERAALATDAGPGSPYSGRTYALWTKLSQPFPLVLSYTADGAKSWTAPAQVNNPFTRSAGGDIAVGPGGVVYACWAGVTETSPFREVMVGFASSANGGENWNVNENAFTVNGITGILPEKGNIRVNGLPFMAIDTNDGPRKGWIYIVTGQKDLAPAGSDPDIVMYRSANGGDSWSQGIRVNQDPAGNGKIQYFPNIYVDQSGAVNVIFYDDRNTTSDSCGVFLARSGDGGNTWMEYEISDHHFKPVPIGGLGQGYQGDVIDITSTGTQLWPVWMDNSSGIYQVWTAPVDFSFLNEAGSHNDGPAAFSPVRNYPNPFSTFTRIGFRILQGGHVTLEIFDVLGNKIAEPVKGIRPPGYYEVEFDPSNSFNHLPAVGNVFFYRLMMDEKVQTGRMIRIN